MSTTQILAELPKLTFEERSRIIEEANELNHEEAEREAVEWCGASGLALLQHIDESEDHASRNPQAR
jgi:hypothetical protein